MIEPEFDEAEYVAANPDVAAAVKMGHFRSGREHYEKYGRKEGRMLKQLLGTTSREEKVFHLIDKAGQGLEIGPSHNPIAPKKKGFNVHILDHASAAELRNKYQGHGVDLDNIEEVDFVWHGEPLQTLIGQTGCYDWIIASHLIEHTPDLITFLAECEKLLKPDGVLSLIIPDKRYCFDYFSAATSTGELLDAFEQKRKRPSPGKVFDHFAGAAKRGGKIAWDIENQGTLEFAHDFSVAQSHWQRARVTEEYIDVHNWRFTPASFHVLLGDLQRLGLTRLEIKAEFDTVGCEFYVSLRKSSTTQTMNRLLAVKKASHSEVFHLLDKTGPGLELGLGHNPIAPKMDRCRSFLTLFLKKYSIISAILLVAACAIAIGNVATVLAWHVPVPFSDEWDEFPRMIALQDVGWPIKDVLSFLWEQHSEHRIVIPKIIYLIDLTLFSYRGYFPLVCIFLLQTMLAGMLIWLLVGKGRNSWEILPLVALVIVAAFDLIQWENFVSTFQTSFVGCFAFSVAAFVLYAKFTVTRRRLYLWCTVLFAMLASLSLASGLFVWIALALLAYLIHAKRYVQSFSFVGAFLAFLLLYLLGYISPAHHASPVDSLVHHPLLVLNYLTVWLGNVTGTVSSAKLLGSIALLMLLVITIYLAQDRNGNRRVEIYTLLAICMFVLIGGIVTSLGRISFGVDQAMAIRYATPALVLWISLLGCLLLLALEFRRPLYVGTIVGLILIAFAGLVIRNYREEMVLISIQNQQVQAYLALVTGQYKARPELLLPLYPAPGRILHKIDLLKTQNISSFSATDASPFKIGSMFPPLTMQRVNDCRGHIDVVTAVGNETYQVTGWAWDEILSSYPKWIFLVQDGNIVGLGKPGVQRPDVLAANPTINKMRVGWQGIARGLSGIGTDMIEAYISTKSGGYCRL